MSDTPEHSDFKASDELVRLSKLACTPALRLGAADAAPMSVFELESFCAGGFVRKEG